MEFTVKKYDLLGELNLTQGVVERKTTIPILSHLLCEAKGNRVTLTATDLELSIRTSYKRKKGYLPKSHCFKGHTLWTKSQVLVAGGGKRWKKANFHLGVAKASTAALELPTPFAHTFPRSALT